MEKLKLTDDEKILLREVRRAELLGEIKGLFKKTFLKGIFDAKEEVDKNAEELLNSSDATKGVVEANQKRKLRLKKEAFEKRTHHYLARKEEADSRYIFDGLLKRLERVYELIYVDILRCYEIMARHHKQYEIVDNVRKANNMVAKKMNDLGAMYNRKTDKTDICVELKEEIKMLINFLKQAKEERWRIEKVEEKLSSILDTLDPFKRYPVAIDRIREAFRYEIKELKEGLKDITAVAAEEFMGK